MNSVWLNGKIVDESEARLSPFDRGFALADGVFETIRVRHGAPLWLADHFARLRLGADCLGIPVPWDDGAMDVGIASLVSESGHADSAVRVTLTRGPSRRRGLWPPDDHVHPTLFIAVAALSQVTPQRMTVARTTRRNQHSPLSQIKSLNYGDNLLARREAIDRGYTDAVMLNGRGNVACCTVGNLFLQIEGRWVTAPTSEGILPGLARARLIKKLAVAEVIIDEPALKQATAAFVSNSLQCAPIVYLCGRSLPDESNRLDLMSLYSREEM
jgi:branched-chain amino acid aminotransferase